MARAAVLAGADRTNHQVSDVPSTFHDVHEAQDAATAVYFPHRLDVLADLDDFDMHLDSATIGSVTASVLAFGAEVQIETDDIEVAYLVNVPLGGVFTSVHQGATIVADQRTALLHLPVGPNCLRGFGHGEEMFGLKIERQALETELACLLNRSVAGPLLLSPTLDLSCGAGLQWWNLARCLVELVRGPADLLTRPMVARPLANSLVRGLLYAAEHPYRQELHENTSAATPAVIRRAIDLLEARPEYPFTVSEIARQSGSSVRTLQAGFERHLGTSPMAYLKNVRLGRAHADLLAGDPAESSVLDIMSRWGWTHVGRFAAVYRAAYGVNPSETLRSC
ncbi:MAG: transcriptional regulator, AraC family [Frankiales bacterium]|nr:transcriptional regulator, AraC family [Frankiales bacterium]